MFGKVKLLISPLSQTRPYSGKISQRSLVCYVDDLFASWIPIFLHSYTVVEQDDRPCFLIMEMIYDIYSSAFIENILYRYTR